MLITFYSKVMPEVLMLEEHARPLLVAAGKITSQSIPIPQRGVFTVEQLEAAIAGIEEAIHHSRPSPSAYENDQDEQDNLLAPMAQQVSLQQRAFPLLDMLKKSRLKNVDVMWQMTKG
jgi:hypothetical protein